MAEVVLLDYIMNFSQDKDLFIPLYFKEELQIEDCQPLIRKLEKQGLLYKDDKGVLSVSEKGRIFLNENDDYVKFFKAAVQCVSISDYMEQKRKMKSNQNFTAVMVTLLLKQIPEHKKRDDFIGVKNLHFDIGYLYEYGGYRPQAMYHYLTSMYYETCGLEYYDNFLKYIDKKQTAKELERLYSYTYISPQIMNGIKRVKDTFCDEMVDKIYKDNPISINICNKENFKELACAIIEEKYVNKDWQMFFWKKYKKLIEVVDKF